MREYNKRVILAFIAFIIIFVLVRSVVVPASFGEYGGYRGASVGEIGDRQIAYTTSEECAKCHPGTYNSWSDGTHKDVNCETCKGPRKEHAEKPGAQKIKVNTSREFCGLCHAKNPSRPKSQPQKDINAHNKGQLCIACHDPHNPVPTVQSSGEISSESSAAEIFNSACARCHSDISKLGDLSRSEEEWKGEVNRMNEKFGLGLSNEQTDLLSDYIKSNTANG